MDVRQLRSFCTAAKHHSIVKAADDLEIGQPTVTTHIRKLEEELGVVLFDRARRPIELTPSGSTLAGLATPLMESLDTLAAQTAHGESRVPVTVAAVHDIVPHALIRVVRVFLHRHPESHLRIRSAPVQEVLNMVTEGEVDLGLTPYPGKSNDLDFAALFTYERVLITQPGHPILGQPLTSLDQIAKYPLILLRKGNYTRVLLEEELGRRGTSYDVLVELDSMDMIKRYVALGMGIAVGPRLAIEPEDENELGIVSLANLLPVEQAGVVTRKGRTLSTSALNFLSVMKDTLSVANGRRPSGSGT